MNTRKITTYSPIVWKVRKVTKTSKHCPGSGQFRSILTRATALKPSRCRPARSPAGQNPDSAGIQKKRLFLSVLDKNIHRRDADFPFLFAGALDELEFVRAFLYIVYKDNSSHGIYYKAAEAGKLVYTHSMAVKVARWWALPDNIKYRGYRVDL